MPRLNSRGQAVMGVGGGPCSVDGTVINTVGGCASWFTDDIVVYGTGSDSSGWAVVGHNIVNNVKTPILSHGANSIAAGGGSWLTWTAGVGLQGTLNLVGGSTTLAGTDSRGEIGRDGTIAYIPSQQAGMPTVIRSSDGLETAINEPAYGLCVVGPGQAVWNGGKSVGMGSIQTFPDARGIRVAGPWFVYWCESAGGPALIAQLSAQLREGIIVHRGNDAFYHDAVMVGEDLHIVWSATPGEGPTDLRREVYNPARVQQELKPFTTQPQPIPESDTQMQAFDRKLWIAPFFSHSERYGATPVADHVGNAILLVENTSDDGALARELQAFAPLGLPMIVDGSKRMYPAYVNTTVAYWTGSAADAQHCLQLSDNPESEKPVIWYEDTGNPADWPASRPGWVNERVYPAVQTYRSPGEDLAAFESRMRAVFSRVMGYGRLAMMVPRFDDYNGNGSIAQTLEAMPVYERLMRDFPIFGFLPFSDRRGNAISKNPELHQWAMEFKHANPTRPNRFDYWQSATVSMEESLANKFGQTTLLITLTEKEKKFILDSLHGNTPEPEPEPPPTGEWPNKQQLLTAVRNRYPVKVTADQCVAIINEVAATDPSLGLLKKTGGNRGLQPKTGIPCSTDWVILKDGRGADVLGDTGNSETGELGFGTPAWPSDVSDETQDPARWVAPVRA